MKLFFFGADKPWYKLSQEGFYRRNTCLLKAFVNNDKIGRVYVVHRTIRTRLIREIYRARTLRDNRVKDVFIATILPPKFQKLNRWAVWLQLFLQLERFPALVDIVFAYWPKGYRHFKESGLGGKLIFDADHDLLDNPNVDKAQKRMIEEQLAEIGQRAAKIIASTRSVIEWFNSQGFCHAIRIRNGVDLERFKAVTVRRDHLSKPKIVYAGTLSSWIDWQMLFNLLSLRPDWSFSFVGKPYKNEEYIKLSEYTNVQLLGFKSPTEVAVLLPKFDVGLVVYKNLPGLDVDSMKIYEYLASGLPVVSTQFHSHLSQDFEGLIYTESSAEGFVMRIEEIMKKREIPKSSRSEFLIKSSWDSRVETLINHIQEN